MPRCWYTYTGGNALEPSSHFRSSTKPSCLTGPSICAIYAPSCDISPSPFSQNMQNYISNALTTQVPQPSGVGNKKYVYLKA